MKPNRRCKFQSLLVAPRAGAWIETMESIEKNTGYKSPPARGRGLKLETDLLGVVLFRRPPRGGVD